jgi:hypothetical protein
MGRRQKVKPRLIPEQDRRICGSICFCQLTVVTSCVALVYLTVAIYIPSHRAFKSGMEPVPVTCQTINSTNPRNCQWASCGEWCLTKTSGFCPQMLVTVRRNGTDMELQNCSRLHSFACPPVCYNSSLFVLWITAVLLNILILWDVRPCRQVNVYRYLEESQCLHLQGQSVLEEQLR